MENRSRDRFFPCRTPMLQVKKYDCASAVNATRDLAFLNMFLMTLINFPEISDASIFAHKVDLLIVSNVFLKSTKQQYNGLRLLRYKSASDFRTNWCSIVEKADLKPACSACTILLFSIKLVNFLFKQLVKSLPKHLCSCWSN